MTSFENPSAEDLYLAAQRAINAGEGLPDDVILNVTGDDTATVLATLARLRYAEQAVQLGAAKMLGVPVSAVTTVTNQIAATLLLERVMRQKLPLGDALALSGGYGAAQLVKASQEMPIGDQVSRAVAAIENYLKNAALPNS